MEVQGFSSSEDERIAAPPPRLAVRDGSNASGITKLARPKIKIVHVFEPEIMVTDAANFRDLVQRFTGKLPPPPPSVDAAVGGRKMKKTKKKTLPTMIDGGESEGSPSPRSELEIKEEEVMRRELEEERMMVMANDAGGGFLGEFEGIDFFLEELGDSINCMPLFN